MGENNKSTEMRAPITPGEILLAEFLMPLEISQSAFAKHIGLSRQQVGNIVKGKSAVTSKIALLFADAFGTSAEFWLNLQRMTDLWQARQGHESISCLQECEERTTKYRYQQPADRVKELQAAWLDELDNCSQELKLVLKDRSQLNYPCCYFELVSYPDPNDAERIVDVVIVAPEHLPAFFLEMDELLELVETQYKGKKNKKKKVDLLKQWKKTVKKREKKANT